MSSLQTRDLLWIGAVATAHAGQMTYVARQVGNFRRKHKIAPPRTDGPPEFIRALRAQQNSLEFGVCFQIVLWSAGIFSHQVPAALLGCVYVISRHKYYHGYVEDAEKRVGPFWAGARALQGLLALTTAGLVNLALKEYANVDLVSMLRDRFF